MGKQKKTKGQNTNNNETINKINLSENKSNWVMTHIQMDEKAEDVDRTIKTKFGDRY